MRNKPNGIIIIIIISYEVHERIVLHLCNASNSKKYNKFWKEIMANVPLTRDGSRRNEACKIHRCLWNVLTTLFDSGLVHPVPEECLT
jgi:hypothetical protein